MFRINRDKNLYGWIDQKLGEAFKYEISPGNDSTIDSEQLLLWFLRYLKEKLETNKEIHEIFTEIFEKILNQIPNKKLHVWFGFDPNKVPPRNLFNSIFHYLQERAYDNIVKSDPVFKNFVGFKSNDFKEIIQEQVDINSRVVFWKPELGVELFLVKGKSFEPNVKGLRDYLRFKETIEKFESECATGWKVAFKALILYDPHSKPLNAFERTFGQDKKFKEEYYTIWEGCYKLSPLFFPVKKYYYNHDPQKSDEENRKERQRAMLLAIMEAVERKAEKDD